MPVAQPGDLPSQAPTSIDSPVGFVTALLDYMHLPDTSSNQSFLLGWVAQEGGNWHNSARYNPLNTTQRMPGSTVMGGGSSAGVQAYTSWEQGLQATAQTLRNGRYDQIMASLTTGSASQANAAGELNANLSTWGTGRVTNAAGGASPSATTASYSTATGGGTYINPIDASEWQTARTDQGVDYLPKNPNTPVKAIGNGTVVYSSTQTGWPGGAFIVYQLADGPFAGKYVYVAEHLTSLVPVGTQVAAGQQIALAQPGYPWTEWGWASGNSDGVLTPYGGAPDGTQTGGGKAFARFLTSLGATVLDNPGPGQLYPGSNVTSQQVSSASSTDTSGGVGAGGLPPPPPLSNMPALLAYINKYFPSDAWMLNTPASASVIENIVSQGITDAGQIQSKIQSSPWWKTTSAAIRAYQQLQATDPAALNFNTPGSQAQQTLMTVQAEAGKLGVNLTPAQAQAIATNFIKFGWQGTTELDQNIGSLVTYGAGGATNAPGVAQQLKAQAGQYLLPVSPQVLQSWSENMVAGTQNMQQFQAYLAQTASAKWTGMASQIQQGLTPTQITDNLRTEAAKTMEVDPNSIDFVNNPMYSKVLDFVPPAAPGHPAQAPAHRLMTSSEMDAYLKGTDNWQYTQQAHDQTSALAQSLAQTWGKMG